jgi:hypothetical protein
VTRILPPVLLHGRANSGLMQRKKHRSKIPLPLQRQQMWSYNFSLLPL